MTNATRIVLPWFRSDNRKSLGLVALAITFIPYGVMADAQQPAGKIPRIGYLDSGSAADRETAAYRVAFQQGLSNLGYVEGKNIHIEFRYDEGKRERLSRSSSSLSST